MGRAARSIRGRGGSPPPALLIIYRAAADVELVRLLHLPAHTHQPLCGYCTCPHTPVTDAAVAFDCLALAIAPACTHQPLTRLSQSIASHSRAEQLLMWS